MTLRSKWVLTITAFLTIAAAMGVTVSHQILARGALAGTEQWLRGAYENTVQKHLELTFRELAADEQMLRSAPAVQAALKEEDYSALAKAVSDAWPTATPGTFWLVAAGPVVAATSSAACAALPAEARLHEGKERLVLCDKTAALLAAASPPSELPRLYLGRVIDDDFAFTLHQRAGLEVVVYGPAGPLGSSLRDLRGEPFAPPRSPAALGDAQGSVRFDDETHSTPGYAGFRASADRRVSVGATSLQSLTLRAPLERHGPSPEVQLLMLFPMELITGPTKMASGALALAFVVIIAGLSVAAFWLVRRLIRPLDELTAAAHRVGEGDLSARVETSQGGDLSSLAQTFNEMVDKLASSRDRAVQSEKMAAIGQLAAGVAHEINNPLGVILGFAQGMDKRVPEGDPMRLPVGSIVREATRCKNLVQELLTFSRVNGRTREAVDLNQLTESCALILSTGAKSGGLELNTELSEGLPRVMANRSQLQQVIINLGGNAIDATAPGGRVTLRTSGGPDEVRLEVSDTGCGISEEVLGRIFEPFFSTKEPGKGTGLGLSLVWEIVGQHEGKIEVSSQVAVGTTFTVDLKPEQAAGTDTAPLAKEAS